MRNLTAVAVAALMLVALPVAADSEKKKDEAPPPKSAEAKSTSSDKKAEKPSAEDERPVVVTTEWLEEHYGATSAPETEVSSIVRPDGSSVASDAAGTAGGVELPDALTEIEDEKARQKDRERMIARLDREIEASDSEIAKLERRILAVKNPFLPRPQIPEDRKAAWDLMTPTERIATTQSQLDELRRQAEALRERRDDLANDR
jgi:hypothetical protein